MFSARFHDGYRRFIFIRLDPRRVGSAETAAVRIVHDESGEAVLLGQKRFAARRERKTRKKQEKKT